LKTTVTARLVALAVVAIALAGCSAINPITTDDLYAPSDGIDVAIGDQAKAINLLVVTTAKDASAVLTGSLSNDADKELVVTLSIDGTRATNVTVPAGSTVQLGTGDHQNLVQGASPAAPGGIAPVWVGTDETGALQADVPVVDGTQAEYQGIVDSIPPLPSATP
jgi:hypothetical protein